MNVKLILAYVGAVVVLGLLYGSYILGTQKIVVKYETSPLCISSCPEPTPLIGDDFGATTLKLMEIGVQYRQCRTACLADKKKP